MNTLFTLHLIISILMPAKKLCSTSMESAKAYAVEIENGKTYFVSYIRPHATAAHIRTATPTSMDCEMFYEWCAEMNLTVVDPDK